MFCASKRRFLGGLIGGSFRRSLGGSFRRSLGGLKPLYNLRDRVFCVSEEHPGILIQIQFIIYSGEPRFHASLAHNYDFALSTSKIGMP